MAVTLKVTASGIPPQVLQDLDRRLRDFGPVRRDFGERMLRSIQKNFSAGGRPEAWAPSQRVLKRGGKTLINSGRLKNSITYRLEGQDLVVGTNVVYAAAHQFGVDKQVSGPAHTKQSVDGRRLRVGSKSRHMRRPARPFLLIQDEDLVYLGKQIKRHLLRGDL